MKLNRTKNATNNIIFGFILKTYQIIIPFVIRTVILYVLGTEYLGLSSLFTSILQVLNLAELGIGSAMIYSMYKPIVNDDTITICALMKLYKIYYRIIGIIILIIGIIICPFLPNLIKSGVPSDINIYILYLLNLLATVLSYWLFAYKNCLLYSHQRNDVISKIALIINTIVYIFQFLLLFFFKNYYLYVITLLLGQAIMNITTSLVVDKMYPKYKAHGSLDKGLIKDINNKTKDLFTSKIGAVMLNSSDSIVISAFLGLTILATYQNYYYILTAIIGIVGVIFNSCTAGIGNSVIVESKEKNYNDFKKFTFIISWIAGVCSCCLLCLYQPFMKIWVGEKYLLEFSCVICLVVYYYIYEINSLLNLYKDASGIWHKDRFRPLITAIANLFMNLLLINFIGIYGVLFSTVLAILFIGMPWLLHNLFSEIFKRSPKEFIIKIFKYFISTILIVYVTYYICGFINADSIIGLLLRGLMCFLISNMLHFVIYRHFEEMNEVMKLVKKILYNKKYSSLKGDVI